MWVGMDVLFWGVVICYTASAVEYILYLFFQKDRLERRGFIFIIAGFILHSIIIGFEFAMSGHFPASNLHQILSVAAWILSGVYIIFQYQFDLKIIGFFIAPFVMVIMAVASWVPKTPDQVSAVFKNFWLIFHVIIIFIGEAFFALACGVGILYLIQEKSIKSKRRGFFYKRLPSLEVLDSSGYVCIIAGFTFLTLGLISGFVYAKIVWGRFWSWDPKEVWAGITWLFYAALLHERFAIGWRGKRAAIMSIIGFAVVLFTFLGVNFMLKGHHGEFTRW